MVNSLFSLQSISKKFPGTQALQKVSLDIFPGEIHALCGENGSGKTTLMRIIAGINIPDEGSLILNNQVLHNHDIFQARQLGINMVHQERSLIPELSIAENIHLGRLPTCFGMINYSSMEKRTNRLLQELNISLNPWQLVSSLSPANQQIVEIARALSEDLRILILDEPTATLSVAETKVLFTIIRKLKQKNIAVIYISHHLSEVFAIADKVTVLKDGKMIGTFDTKKLDETKLNNLMIGRDLTKTLDTYRPPARAPILLKIKNLYAMPNLKNINLEVRAGEIICLTGLIGSGRTELCETIFGIRPHLSGQIIFNGKKVHIKSPNEALKLGIAMVPEDRKQKGLFLDKNCIDNVIVTDLANVSSFGMIFATRSFQRTQTLMKQLHIVPHFPQQLATHFSGGNQQKLLLAKWLALKPQLLIIDEPSIGVDVGAREEIYHLIKKLAKEKIGILIVSSDTLEVLALAHRVLIMTEGHIIANIPVEEATELSILQLTKIDPLE